MRLSARGLFVFALVAAVGCGGSSNSLSGGPDGSTGSGGQTGSGGAGSGGAAVGSGGDNITGSGGEMVGSGGEMMGTGGAGGGASVDAAPPEDASGTKPDAIDARADAPVDGRGAIMNCAPGARCRSMRPEPTCMAMCPGGTERVCTCGANGMVACAACPRTRPDGGAGDASDGGGTDARPACPAGARNGGACMMNQEVCGARCPAGPMPETCTCLNRIWRCVARCM
jgi:hypothetical protein